MASGTSSDERGGVDRTHRPPPAYGPADVNECAVNNGGCGQICNDTTPGYFCSCYSGYQLLLDGINCTSECWHNVCAAVWSLHLITHNSTMHVSCASILQIVINTYCLSEGSSHKTEQFSAIKLSLLPLYLNSIL